MDTDGSSARKGMPAAKKDEPHIPFVSLFAV